MLIDLVDFQQGLVLVGELLNAVEADDDVTLFILGIQVGFGLELLGFFNLEDPDLGLDGFAEQVVTYLCAPGVVITDFVLAVIQDFEIECRTVRNGVERIRNKADRTLPVHFRCLDLSPQKIALSEIEIFNGFTD